jgi:beta-xylosidase
MNSRLAHRPCSPKWATGLVARAFAFSCALFGASWGATVSNPFLWSDIPDLSIVRVGNDFYMSHTTMHLAPGVPIMKSTDLVNWKTVGYCYSTLTNSDQMNLNSGKNAYGKGSWASSIRYKDGTFHVLVPSYTTNKTHLYSTKDVEKGPWKEVQFPFYHDPSLHLDDDGRNYVVYGGGDIKIVELNADLSGLNGTQSGGDEQDPHHQLQRSEGASSGTSFNPRQAKARTSRRWAATTTCSPSPGPIGGGFDGRTELVSIAPRPSTGTYEGKIVH